MDFVFFKVKEGSQSEFEGKGRLKLLCRLFSFSLFFPFDKRMGFRFWAYFGDLKLGLIDSLKFKHIYLTLRKRSKAT